MGGVVRVLSVLLVLAAIGAGALLHSQRTRGRDYGHRSAGHTCLHQAVEGLEPGSLSSRLLTSAWLDGCLHSAAHSPGLCEDLPLEGDDFSAWEAEACRGGHSKPWPCDGFGELVRDTCREVETRRREAAEADTQVLLQALAEARRDDSSGEAVDRALAALCNHYEARGDLLGAVIAYRDRIEAQKERGDTGAAFHTANAAQRRLRPLGLESDPAGMLLVLEAQGPRKKPAKLYLGDEIVIPEFEGLLQMAPSEAWMRLPERLRSHGLDADAFGEELRQGFHAWGRGGARLEFTLALVAYALGSRRAPQPLSELVAELIAASPPGLDPEPLKVQARIFELAAGHGDAEQRSAVLVGALNAWTQQHATQTALYRERVLPRAADPILRDALDRGLHTDDGRSCHALAEEDRRWFREKRRPRELMALLQLRTRELRRAGCTVHAFWLEDHVLAAHPEIAAVRAAGTARRD
jgi:hypothetical protein